MDPSLFYGCFGVGFIYILASDSARIFFSRYMQVVVLRVHWSINRAFLFASQLSGCSGSVCSGTSCVRAVSFPRQVIRCACWKLLMAAGEEIAEEVAVYGLPGVVMLGEWGTNPSESWELSVTELRKMEMLLPNNYHIFLFLSVLWNIGQLQFVTSRPRANANTFINTAPLYLSRCVESLA